jgi:hypothetical protein
MGYAVQVWGFSAAWPILGAVSLLALGATAFMRGEEELVTSASLRRSGAADAAPSVKTL